MTSTVHTPAEALAGPARQPSRRAHGRRRMTPDSHLGVSEARGFAGLPDGVDTPHALLSALKKARRQMGVPMGVIDLVDCLYGLTQPQDWQAGSRPLVWPSNSYLCMRLDITLTCLKQRVRRAIELRLISDKPSPNGKRFGVRAKATGCIALDQTFGFDLSLLAVRHAEIAAHAAQGIALYHAEKAMQRRGHGARTGLLQLIETATEQAVWTTYWEQLEGHCASLSPALRRIDQPGALAQAAQTLEELRLEAEGVLRDALANRTESMGYDVESAPKGAPESPLYNSTNQLPASESTCIAAGESGPAAAAAPPDPPAAAPEIEERFSPEVVLAAAPEIAAYCPAAYPGWNEVADAARLVAPQFQISQRLWGRACQVLGAHGAALALAVMIHQSGRKRVHSPGGYFHSMIERARRGELDLRRSYYGMRGRLQ